MAQNEAKVRIGGDASGANAATDKTVRGIKGVADAADSAGKKMFAETEKAIQQEKRFEGEVQKVISRLQKKKEAAAATGEALRRMGDQGDRSTRGAVAGGGVAPGIGSGRLVNAAGGGLGGAGGGILSRLGGAAAGGPALLAVAGAATVLAGAFKVLTARSEEAAKAAAERTKLEQGKAKAIEQGQNQLGQTALNAQGQHGSSVARLALQGVNMETVQGIGSRTGANASTSLELADLLRGLAPDIRTSIEQAFRDSERLGGSGIMAARELSAYARETGHLGTQGRASLAREGMGKFGEGFSEQQIGTALRTPMLELDNLDSLRKSGGKESLAQLGVITDIKAVEFAGKLADGKAADAKDPVGASLREFTKGIKEQAAVFQAMAGEESPLVRSLKDLSKAVKGGDGSYAAQAARMRGLIAAAGG